MRVLLTTLALMLFAPLAMAHEYYLMPYSFTPAVGEEFTVSHRLGQNFKGNEIPYISRWNIRSELWVAGQKRAVAGTDGDRPALKMTVNTPGLSIIAHQGNVDFLTFSSWEKFVAYVEKEGLTHALAPSENGTKPKEKLKEGYARYAKTLVQVGGGSAGLDQPVGLKIELIAKKNPNALMADEAMPVQLLYDGNPMAGITVKVFETQGEDFGLKLITDENGMVSVPPAGPGPTMLNAIHMTDPQGPEALEGKAHWESFWASLTYSRAR
ncbi:MAG: DUF4198 domain-containing protein [Pseudomonadota bacterium]